MVARWRGGAVARRRGGSRASHLRCERRVGGFPEFARGAAAAGSSPSARFRRARSSHVARWQQGPPRALDSAAAAGELLGATAIVFSF